MILLLPGGEGRDEGGRKNKYAAPAACAAHTAALLVQRYFASIGFRSAMVFFGQNFRSVRIAFFSAEWHGQRGSAGICGTVRATIILARSALRFRFWMIIFSVTCSSSVFQQS